MPGKFEGVQETRIRALNDRGVKRGGYVLYWMQQSQRAEYNHALTYAVRQADQIGQGVVVGFGLTDDYPEANLRHYWFMLEGLKETRDALKDMGILMVIRRGHPVSVALSLGTGASMIVCDRGYLRHQREWRSAVGMKAACSVIQVESDVVVPLEVVSKKAEYAARTIRPRIHKHLEAYLREIPRDPPKHDSLDLGLKGLDIDQPESVLQGMNLDRRVAPVSEFFRGGTPRAKAVFEDFLQTGLAGYDKNSNQPHTEDISHMSPYLHFGQISPLYLALRIRRDKRNHGTNRDAYLEQLIVRRELAMNFTHYTSAYDTMACLPAWARKTLGEHRADRRDPVYAPPELEQAQTHDPYWNACMREMTTTGFMHNYMRMYWGKKILEWSPTPEKAFTTLLGLNNRYFLDGRDSNSYAGVGWVFGLHDRAWSERPVFGKTRYMASSGLDRKCDMPAYIKKVETLEKRARGSNA